jgi:hypothetical protein
MAQRRDQVWEITIPTGGVRETALAAGFLRGPLLLAWAGGPSGAMVGALHRPRRLVVVRQRQVNDLGDRPLVGRPGGCGRIPGCDACWRRKLRRGYGLSGCRCGPPRCHDVGDHDIVIVKVAGFLVRCRLLLRTRHGPFAVWFDCDLVDFLGSLSQDLPRVPVRVS